MKLLDTYISEIGRNLPRSTRQDIETEIRSSLQDTLEDRSQQAGRPADDEMIFAILSEYGSPESVAASYLPERYLIGPRLFPIFMTVIRIVLPIIVVVAAIGLGINMARSTLTPPQFFETISTSLLGLAGSTLQALGNIVLIFAILQWFLPNLQAKARNWDPRSLLKIQPMDQIPLAKAMGDIVTTLAAIILFNFYPHILRVWNFNDGSWKSMEVLSAAFFAYIPAWSVIWSLKVMLNLFLLRQGRWQTWTRWTAAALGAATIVMAVAMLAGPALISIHPAELATQFPAGTPTDWVTLSFRITLSVILSIIIITEGIELVKMLYRLLSKNLPLVAATAKK